MIAAFKAATGSSTGLQYRWVAAGNAGYLATSDTSDITSWTTRTSSFGTTVINDVTSNGIDMYVAVGDAGKLATSPDAITWTQRTSSFGTTRVNGVAYGNGIWVAVGEGGKIATATDPTGTWTQRTSGVTTELYKPQYGAGIWVVNGASNVLRSATDPTATWTARTSNIATVANYNALRFCPAQSLFVVGQDNSNPSIATSPDGITWTARSSATAPITNISLISASNASVIAIAVVTNVSAAFAVDTSTNGTTWTFRSNFANYLPVASAVDQTGRMAIKGTNALTSPVDRIWTSDDGITWTQRTAPTSNNGLCHSSGG